MSRSINYDCVASSLLTGCYILSCVISNLRLENRHLSFKSIDFFILTQLYFKRKMSRSGFQEASMLAYCFLFRFFYFGIRFFIHLYDFFISNFFFLIGPLTYLFISLFCFILFLSYFHSGRFFFLNPFLFFNFILPFSFSRSVLLLITFCFSSIH